MYELSLFSQVSLYVLLGIMGLFTLIILGWQIKVIKGKAMKNPDGTFDSWKEQKTHYGIAFADILFACPCFTIYEEHERLGALKLFLEAP